mmetsp:Transcript_53663/g.142243  ORF Transcript_53663/g.142243 Transcript_53663/m.142243 type:complete len:201 (-) Transcript_53663:248-850(-)
MSYSTDVADILGTRSDGAPKPKKSSGGSRPLKSDSSKEGAKSKSTKGFSREVFALTGGAPQASQPHKTQSPYSLFPDKRKGISKHVHWEWKEFVNGARTDELTLRHWQKKGLDWEEYPFVRFNKTLNLLKYSDEEYEEHLKSTTWTREESDNLLDLVERFGMNFFLVHDRWNCSERRWYFVDTQLFSITILFAPPIHSPN